MKNYKVIATIEFPNGNEEYVVWEPELYGQMVMNNIDIHSLFYDTSKNGFRDAPLNVRIDLYDNPTIQEIGQTMNSEHFTRQLLVGKKVIPMAIF